ncbi:MAG: acyl-CoA carboxylase subunit beta [Rhodobacteraceae bacterium]|nr:acyl-CoA carboxylase subunit beta [Paracoccaceae bacterium]
MFQSDLQPDSPEATRNRAAMMVLVDRMRELEARAADKSGRSAARFAKRGQCLPRERLARLLDPGAPFLTIGNMAGYLRDGAEPDASVPGASQIAGIGYVSGIRCMIVANDSGIDAGAITDPGGEKIIRAQEIALENRLPFIFLVESAGANLMRYRVERFIHGGAIFRNLSRLSAAGCPVITVLHGSSTAGGAYMPGLSDYVISVRGRGRAFLGGPPLVKAATGETADAEELGGAEMHSIKTGLVEYLAEDDVAALGMARKVIGGLKWDRACHTAAAFDPPRYSSGDLAAIVPADSRKPYDMREIAARLTDGSDFTEFKPLFGPQTVCLQGTIHGHNCAIIGNNGPIDNAGAMKAAQFIQLCCQLDRPIIYLQNTTGYMVGVTYEQAGMIKNGAAMIQAVANATVPQITLMIGASFGAGNYGMCGRAFEPRFLFSWPNASTGVMGGEQAAKTMTIVATEGAALRGQEPDMDALRAQEDRIIKLFGDQADAFTTSGLQLDDGMIDPCDSRKVLGFCLATIAEAAKRKLHPVTFGTARF